MQRNYTNYTKYVGCWFFFFFFLIRYRVTPLTLCLIYNPNRSAKHVKERVNRPSSLFIYLLIVFLINGLCPTQNVWLCVTVCLAFCLTLRIISGKDTFLAHLLIALNLASISQYCIGRGAKNLKFI